MMRVRGGRGQVRVNLLLQTRIDLRLRLLMMLMVMMIEMLLLVLLLYIGQLMHRVMQRRQVLFRQRSMVMLQEW